MTDTNNPQQQPVNAAVMRVGYSQGRYRMTPAWKPTDTTPPAQDTYLRAPFRELLARDYTDTPAEVWVYPIHSTGGPFTRPTKEARPELIKELLGTELKGAAILADIDDEPAHNEKRHSEPTFFKELERALERFKSVPGWLYYRTLRGARVGLILAEPAELDTYQEARNELYELIAESLEGVAGADLDRKCKDLARGFAAPHITKRGEPISPAHAQLWTHPQDTPPGHVEGLAQRWRARLKDTANATRTAHGERERPRQEKRREGARSASPNSPTPTKTKKTKTYIPAPEHRAELTGPQLYELARSAFAQVCRLTGDEALRLEMLQALDAHLMDGRRAQKEGAAWFERTLEEYAARYPLDNDTEARAGDALPEPAPIAEHPELSPLRRIFEHGDDLELAEAVIESFGTSPAPLWHGEGLRRYDAARGVWRLYGPHALKRIISSARGAQLASGKPYNVTMSAANAALKWCASLCGADTPSTAFDTAPRGVVLSGGVFVYASRDGLKVESVAPHHYAIHALDVELSQNTRAYFESDGDEGQPPPRPPVFTDRFLSLSLEREPDESKGESEADVAREISQKIDTIGEWLGLALLGLCTREAVALVVHGPGSNGKSVLTSLVADLFGPEQTAHLAPQKMGEKFSRAQLFGAAVNVVAEMPESDLLASDALKAIISGDTIEVERKNQDPFSFAPRAAHIFAANRLPASRDRSHGLWRRLLPISFHRTFTKAEADRTLGEALRAELPALVQWALERARGYLARGDFEHTALIAAERWAWREVTDGVAAFFRERLELTESPKEGDTISALWEAFRAWGESVGLEGARRMSLTAFSLHLTALPGVEKARVKKAGEIKTRVNVRDTKAPTTAASAWNTP
jgi:P4 family phage/plasmid primase-like protien